MTPHLFAVSASAALLLSSLALAAPAAASTDVEIKDAIARVVVVPEARADVTVEVRGGRGDLPKLRVSQGLDGRMVIDGGLARRIHSCSRTGFERTRLILPMSPPASVVIQVWGLPDVRLPEAPVIILHTPRDVKLHVGGAVFGAVARAQSVLLESAGCGDWIVGNVAGALEIGIAGSGDVDAGSARRLKARIAGSGDVRADSVGEIEAEIAGSGDVKVRRANGPAHAQVAGSGNLEVAGGTTPRLEAEIAGSGDVRFGGDVGTVEAKIVGSGDIRVHHVSGPVHKMVMGSGEVLIGG
jgi:hypothetical protein